MGRASTGRLNRPRPCTARIRIASPGPRRSPRHLGSAGLGNSHDHRTSTTGSPGGAVAVKVWKDVGMVLKDPDGKYVMADDARLDPVFSALAKQGRTLVAHLGEPRNCWLPVDQMTVDGDRRYFAAHPEYHGLLHPEIPNYEAQVAARDRMLERHPTLRVVGCHLGSLEYDVDELAKRLDKYPNLAVDLSARIVHLQIQPRDKVRAFLREVPGPDSLRHRPAVRAGGRMRRMPTRRNCWPGSPPPTSRTRGGSPRTRNWLWRTCGQASGRAASRCPSRCCGRSTTRTRGSGIRGCETPRGLMTPGSS